MKMKIIFLICLLTYIHSLQASTGCNSRSSKPKIISKEIDSVNGNISIDLYLVVFDSLRITNDFLINKPSNLNIQVLNIPDTSIWYIPGDTVYFNGTISHGIGWVPFFSLAFSEFCSME